MILNVLFSILGVASGGFLAYGGWVCLRHLMSDRTRSLSKKPRVKKTRAKKAHAPSNWPRAARVS
jgi:threonine/homoserine/homoserine lactone efflux protein